MLEVALLNMLMFTCVDVGGSSIGHVDVGRGAWWSVLGVSRSCLVVHVVAAPPVLIR